MNLIALEVSIRRIGGLLAAAMLAIILYGIWRGNRRPAGRTTGRLGPFLRSFWLYFASSLIFFGISYIGWIPLPIHPPPPVRTGMLALGSLLYFPGMALALWGRLALGGNYFVSTAFGAQLFVGHQLVRDGPFAIVRHPMYAGLMLAAAGSFSIYATWTTLFFACLAPLLVVRAGKEEQALAAEFGEQWRAYCKRVPAYFPRLRKR